MKSKSIKLQHLIIQLIVFLSLVLSFYANVFRIANDEWFSGFERFSESLIIGRMVKSQQDGVFSAGGLTGAGIPTSIHDEPLTDEQIAEQYKAYYNNENFEFFTPYMSQIGGQGMLFGFLNNTLPFSPAFKLNLFWLLTSVFAALAFILIIRWFYLEFGVSVAFFVFLSIILSYWITGFARNIWWGLWAFYLPMVVVMYFLRGKIRLSIKDYVKLSMLIFGAVLIKCIVNGNEFITTTLAMMVVPIVYYMVKHAFRKKDIVRLSAVAVTFSVLAVITGLIILAFQVAAYKGTFSDGVEHIIYSFTKRTSGNEPRFEVNVSVFQVVLDYLKGGYFDLNNYINVSNHFVSYWLIKFNFGYLIFIIFLASVYLWSQMKQNSSIVERKTVVALLVACWFSILAPVSWLLVFKEHSHVHMHMDYIIWHMPFTLFGFAVIGQSLVVAQSKMKLKRVKA